MISYLTDLVLMFALVITSWRTAVMYRELRQLRSAGSELAAALRVSEQVIADATRCVSSLKGETLATLPAIEARTAAAREIAHSLEQLVRRAEWHCASRPSERNADEASSAMPPVSRQPRPLAIEGAAQAAF